MPQRSVERTALARWIAAGIVAVILTGGYVQPDQPALATGGDGSARLSLPWPTGEFWRLTGGPHSEQGGRTRPWSAVDFQPESGTRGKVRAARGGVVRRPCPNLVLINHG